MKTQEHTAGPWEQDRDLVYVQADGHRRLLAEIVDVNLAPEGMKTHELPLYLRGIREANARLIAAAPQLLEALEKVSEWLDNGSCYTSTEDREIVRAAIRSAKGETL